jgi:peptidoglycan/xylan/chitin deacetylase (PgdA/CDA1 family)
MASGRHARPRRAETIALVVVSLALCVGAVAGFATWRAARSSDRAVASQRPESAPRAVASAGPVSPAASRQPTAQVSPSNAAQTAAKVPPAAPTPPPLPEFSAKRYLGKPLNVVPNRKHEVALTLDDGPGEDTGRVLEILREHHVHVTFFVVGRRASKHTSSVREMVEQGHEVGNHTWTHPEPGAVSESALAKQFDRTQKLVAELTGHAPRFARTRGGTFTDTTMANLKSRGIVLAHWSIHSNDVEPSPSVAQIVTNATGGATSGSIILLHETNPNTVLALPAILKELERKGLHPVTLSQLVADDTRAAK